MIKKTFFKKPTHFKTNLKKRLDELPAGKIPKKTCRYLACVPTSQEVYNKIKMNWFSKLKSLIASTRSEEVPQQGAQNKNRIFNRNQRQSHFP